jgi:hypothetical protein
MIDHNVMRLHISVHDALAVTVVERLQQLGDVVPDVQVVELGVEASEVGVVDIFEYERRSLTLLVTLEASERGQVEEGRGEKPYLRIPNHIQESNDIGTAGEILKDLDFALDLLFLDRFQHLDDAFLVVDNVNAFENLRVLAPACR